MGNVGEMWQFIACKFITCYYLEAFFIIIYLTSQKAVFMDAVIKVKISELNVSLLERLKFLFQGDDEAELTITYDDKKQKYKEALDRSKKQLELGTDLITFQSIDELEAYANSKRA